MTYYRCSHCGLTLHSGTRRFTQTSCPNCSVPLSGADRILVREHHPAAITRQFPVEPGASAAARRALETLLWSLDDAEFQVTALLMSELVANSVEHSGASMQGSIGVDIQVTEASIRVEVADGGRGFVPAARTATSPLDSHWGLYLVDELAARWGADAPRAAVWFELDRVPSAASAEPHLAATGATAVPQERSHV